MSARLRVGVPVAVTQFPPQSSAGRIWHHALAHLDRATTLVVTDPTRRRWRRRVDVWLSDGHLGPLPVREPVVAMLHEASWSDPMLRPLFEREFLETYERPSEEGARAARIVLTVSESSRAQIVEAYGIAPEAVRVASPGIDHDTYHPDAGPAGPLLEAAGGDPTRPYVLFASVVHPRKNLVALREAMARIAAHGLPHALVLVAGPAADRADSSTLMASATAPIPGVATPVVNLAGSGDQDVARLMAGAACFCLPSFMEGFGMTVAEAMACGTPVIVSDRGSLPEVVGDAGVVVAPDAAAVEAALLEVLCDPARAQRLAAAGRARASRFRWDGMGDRWLAALEAATLR